MKIETGEQVMNALKDIPNAFTQRQLLKILRSEPLCSSAETARLATAKVKWDSYSAEQLMAIFKNSRAQWLVGGAAMETQKLSDLQMRRIALDLRRDFVQDHANIIIDVLIERKASLMEMIAFAKEVGSGIEHRDIVDLLKTAIAERINWEIFNIEQIIALIVASAFHHRFVRKAVEASLLSLTEFMALACYFDSRHADSFVLVIKGGQLSRNKMMALVGRSRYDLSVMTSAIETKKLSRNDMFELWAMARNNVALAKAIAATGLISDDDKNILAGLNTELLKELT